MAFDNNFRILRSIVPDSEVPGQELSTDFKVPLPKLSLKVDLRAVPARFRGPKSVNNSEWR